MKSISANTKVVTVNDINDGRIAINFSYVNEDGVANEGTLVSHSFFNDSQTKEWKVCALEFLQSSTIADIHDALEFESKIEYLASL